MKVSRGGGDTISLTGKTKMDGVSKHNDIPSTLQRTSLKTISVQVAWPSAD